MRYRHYAPKTPLKLFKTLEALQLYLQEQPSLKRMLLLPERAEQGLSEGESFPLRQRTSTPFLRQADLQDYQEILALCQERESALSNRLLKAASLI